MRCIICTEGDAKEGRLADNIQRAPLHPLDQFRAFLTLREENHSEAEINAKTAPTINSGRRSDPLQL